MLLNKLRNVICKEFVKKILLIRISRRLNSNKGPVLHRSELRCINQCRVGVVGLGRVGKSLAHLLKMFPGPITELRLLNRTNPAGMVEELNQLPTLLPVYGIAGMENLSQGLQDLDIVVISAGVARTKDMRREELFQQNATICGTICKACTEACPKALIAIVSNPIDSLVPVAAEVMKKHGSYDPAKLFGVCKLDQLRARHYFADVIGTHPKWTYVPVVGGHGEETTVPLFSRSRPRIALTPEETMKLVEAVRTAGKRVVQIKKSSTTYSMASAAMYFIHKLSRAVHHEPNVVVSAYVESCVTPARFFSNELILGPGGIDKNLGYGYVSEMEQKLIDNAVKILQAQIQFVENTIHRLKI